jgi:starch synthase
MRGEIPPAARAPRAALPALPGGGSVVHLVAEYWPFARTGGLAEAVRGLAEFQVAAGQRAAVILPLHRHVRARDTALEPAGEPFDVTVGSRREPARIFRHSGGEATPDVFFVEHAGFFDRPEIYGEGADYADNAVRFAYFSRAALEVLPRIVPDAAVLHAHDWHTTFAVICLRTVYAGRSFYDRLGTAITVHNAAFQGHYGYDVLANVGLPASLYDWRIMEWYGHVNILKGGLTFCDVATTVSPTHAAELRTPQGGFGLQEHYIAMGDRFIGILNGIDDEYWNPATDPYITAHFSPDDPSPKSRCKRAAQRTFGLPQRARVPLVAMTARMAEQKGLDLILADDHLLEADAQFVFLGTGERRYETALAAFAARAPDRVVVPLTYNERLEHRLLAGADVLLMPSLYEPCGLTQMRAQRYGALPVARRVGGLNDTIEDDATGFLFNEYRADAFEAAFSRAVTAYHHRARWDGLVRRAMRLDHSWRPSAERYQAAYRRAVAAHRGIR